MSKLTFNNGHTFTLNEIIYNANFDYWFIQLSTNVRLAFDTYAEAQEFVL